LPILTPVTARVHRSPRAAGESAGDPSAGDFRAGVGPALGVAAGLSALGAIAALLMRQRQAAGASPARSPVTADVAEATVP
jgi:hypothetical protein